MVTTGPLPPTDPAAGRVGRSALQAIRDRSGRTVGYELFFRDSSTATSAGDRTVSGTLQVLAGLAGAGAGNGTAADAFYFVNVTREFLVGELDLPDPSVVSVLEVQPEVVVDAEVVAGVRRLRAQGYGIALERYRPGTANRHDLLLPDVTHVKLDLEGTRERELRAALAAVRAAGPIVVIGCRIGWAELLDRARSLGCHLFQGYALDRAELTTREGIQGRLVQHLKLMEALARPAEEVDLDAVTRLVSEDADLSLRVLQACSTAVHGRAAAIGSMAQAVVLVGPRAIGDIVRAGVVQELAAGDEERLLRLIEFATLTDHAGARFGLPHGTGFLAGLLVEVAELLELSPAELAGRLPLDPALTDALVHRAGPLGRALDAVACYKNEDAGPAALPRETMAELHLAGVTAAIAAAAPLFGRLDGTAATLPPALPQDRPLPDGRADGGVLLTRLLRGFDGDERALADWLIRPCQALGRRVPLQLLLDGKVDQVLAEAARRSGA